MDAVDAALKHNPDDAGIQSMARALESAFEQIVKQREAAEKEAAEAAAKEAEQKEEERKQKEASKKSKRSSSTGKSIFTTVIGTAITYFAKTVATQLARNLTKKKKK